MLSASRRPTGYRRWPVGHEVDDRGPAVGVGRRGDHAGRLVQRVDDARARPAHELAVDRDRLLAGDVARRVGDHGAVDGHPPVGDERLRRAPRGDAGVGEVLSEAHGAHDASPRLGHAASALDEQPAHDADRGVDRRQRAHLGGDRAGRCARYDGSPVSRTTASRSPAIAASGPPPSAIPAPSASHALGVPRLVGEERHDGHRHAAGQAHGHGARAAVADHRRHVGHEVGLRRPSARRARWPARGPSSAGSRSRPTVTSRRTRQAARARRWRRGRGPGRSPWSAPTEPKVT